MASGTHRGVPVLLTAALGLGACDSGITCPAGSPLFAVGVVFRHAGSEEVLPGATPGRLVDGGYVDSLKVESLDTDMRPVTMGAALGRVGVYRLEAHRPGFEPFLLEGIVAPQGACGVLRQFVVARLVPEG